MELQLLNAIETELREDRTCMLATIIERFGSAPRGTGTGMVITRVGTQTGTLGGGSLEYRARLDAIFLLSSANGALKEYEIHTDGEMAYSGSVRVLFRVFTGVDGKALCSAIREAYTAKETAYLVCELAKSGVMSSRVMHEAQMSQLCAVNHAPEQAICTNGETRWLIEPLLPAPRVIVFGGGHVAQCMVRQLGLLDFRIWVAEDRAEFAQSSLFPAAEHVLLCDYAQAEKMLDITKRDHAIVMSRGHETDEKILGWLLQTEADYIGCIGSKKKIALLTENLLKLGMLPDQLERLHAPIGLPIGAQTPAEIAVSVAAELISHVRN